MSDEPDAVKAEVTVAGSAEDAFRAFTGSFTDWWPREFSWGPRVLARHTIAPRVGGRCTEHSTLGNEYDWGRVLAWEPPGRLLLQWQIAPTRAPEPDPERCSEIEVRFEPTGQGTTRVVLEHRGFARHGDGADAYRDAMGGAHGWRGILEAYAELAGRSR